MVGHIAFFYAEFTGRNLRPFLNQIAYGVQPDVFKPSQNGQMNVVGDPARTDYPNV
jgi:hypothetical protein